MNYKKQKFVFDNLLCPNNWLDLADKDEIDKWFTQLAKYTNMIYDPETGNNWARVRYEIATIDADRYLKITLWFNARECKFHFECENYWGFLNQNDFMEKFKTYTHIYDTQWYIMGATFGDVVRELNSIIKIFKLQESEMKKNELEKDFV